MGHLGAKVLSLAVPLAVPVALGASALLGVSFSVSLSLAAVGVGAVFCAALATADADLRLLSLGRHTKSDFEGKAVVIVGASTGIGAALAEYLAKQGAVLVLSSRGTEQLQVRVELLLCHLAVGFLSCLLQPEPMYNNVVEPGYILICMDHCHTMFRYGRLAANCHEALSSKRYSLSVVLTVASCCFFVCSSALSDAAPAFFRLLEMHVKELMMAIKARMWCPWMSRPPQETWLPM